MGTIDIAIQKQDGSTVKLSVRLAITAMQQAEGLMYVEKLDEFDGMLFDFGEDIFPQMGTPDTSISVDFLFFDNNHELVCIHENIAPYDETLREHHDPVRYVLEIGGGRAKALGITVGDILKYQSYFEVIEVIKIAAAHGYANAQHELGVMYQKGEGVEKNYVKAVAWYRKAAEQGHTTAQCALAFMYQDGRGVQQDYLQAACWRKKAAELGDQWAQFMLGNMYLNGRGVPKDESKAIEYYKMSAAQGNKHAKGMLTTFKTEGKHQNQPEFNDSGVISSGNASGEKFSPATKSDTAHFMVYDEKTGKIHSEFRYQGSNDFGTFPQGHGDFGTTVTNPIPTCGITGSAEYLAHLQTEIGEEIIAERVGSVSADNIKEIIDCYTIYNKYTGKMLCKLYLCPYSKKTSSLTPKGFVLVNFRPKGWEDVKPPGQ